MKKAPDAFRTISEVADLLETPAHVLRFWESKFYQIRPVKRAGGRRYYRPDDVALVNGIRVLLQDKTMNIRRVQRMLQEQGIKHVAALGGPIEALTERAAALGLNGYAEDEVEIDVIDDAEINDAEIIEAEAPEDVVDARADRRNDPEPADLTQAEPVVDAEQIRDLAAPLAVVPAAAAPAAFEPAAAAPAAAAPVTTFAPPPKDLAAEVPMSDLHPPAPKEPALAAPDPAPPPYPTARGSLAEASDRASLARQLRLSPRGQLGTRRDRLELVARRIDALLERMSEASGAGRW